MFPWAKTANPQTTNDPPPEPVQQPAASLEAEQKPIGMFPWAATKNSEPVQHVDPSHGSWLTRPISETLFNTSAGAQYDGAVQKLLPESFKREKGGDWTARFAAQLGRGGPEILDFIQSPLGAALVAAHMFPATAPLAAIADVGLGGMGLMQSIPQIRQAWNDGTPESAADAIKSLAFSIGMVKGGSHTLLAKTMQFRAEPLESREAMRSEIRNKPASAVALARVSEKFKTIPKEQIEAWATKPLSEIEAAQRKAAGKHKELRQRTTATAAQEKREVTPEEKQAVRVVAREARMLSQVAAITLPEKIRAVESSRETENPTFSQRMSEKMYASAWLREPAKLINVSKPRHMQMSADIVFDRAAFLAERNLDINRLLYDWRRELPAQDREIQKLGYVMQGDATPEEAGLSAQTRAALPVIREWVKQQDALIRDAYGDEIPLQDAETYLTQVWDFSGADRASRAHASRTLMNDPFLKKKTVESYKVGIEKLGYKPKYNDVLDLLKLRADFASKAIANRRMAGWLRDMGVVISEPEYMKLRPSRTAPPSAGEQPLDSSGMPHSSAGDQTFADWRPATDAVALYRAAYSNKPMDPGMLRAPVFVHPDYADAVNAVFGKGFDNPALNSMETLRALGKKSALTFSMFHHYALSEQAQAIYATRKNPVATLGKTFFFHPEFWRGIKSMLWEAIGREGDAPPVMRVDQRISVDAVHHGLNLASEEQESWLYGKVQEMAESHNVIQKAIGVTAKPVAKVMKTWDRALWEFYHQGMMLDSYEMLKSSELGKLGEQASEGQVREVKRAVAEHVNNAFGSVSYEKMLLSPKVRQALNWFLLAPAWTISNMRVLTSGYETEAGVRLTNSYVKGAAISWFLSTQAMNYALSGHYNRDEKGNPQPRFTWDNPGLPVSVGGRPMRNLSENSFNIYAGKNKDGSERYIVLGKGFREPFGWALEPFKTFWGKVSLPIRGALVQATGHAPGSGFEEIDSRDTDSNQLAQRVTAGMESVGVPFVAETTVKQGMHALFPEAVSAPQSSSQFASLPTRKGTSFMRAEAAYRDAMNAGDFERARLVLAVAAANNIKPGTITRSFNQDKRKKQRRAAQ